MLSRRRKKPFTVVNCSSLPSSTFPLNFVGNLTNKEAQDSHSFLLKAWFCWCAEGEQRKSTRAVWMYGDPSMNRKKGQQPPGVTGGAGEDGPDGEQRR